MPITMMQYQYADDQGHVFQDSRQRAATTRNWRRMKEISVGDRFVAYLLGNKFYAVGTVIAPRRAKTPMDPTDSVEEYVARKMSHEHENGFVYYTPVFYEDFSDNWRHPDDQLMRYAQRIDVDGWEHFIPGGVSVPGLNAIPRPELQMAAFEIDKDYFDRILKKLAAGHAALPEGGIPGSGSTGVDEAVVEALEKSQAKGQGFVLDSKLRKALEDYAMEAAKRYFKALGYKCEDHSKTCHFDLRYSRGREVLYVEVKGTQTDGGEIILTPGEVAFARCHKGQMTLFVLHSIRVDAGNGGFGLGGSERHLIQPWDVDRGKLVPVSYKYGVPDSES
jgi:hypothetical protein